MTPPLTTLGVLVVLVAVRGAVRVASRLDRLHMRTDAAWLALDGALVRRAVVVQALVAAGGQLGAAASRAIAAGPDREIAENDLGRRLGALERAGLDAAHAVGLADAEARVVIARRVYNDAVRDTLALRSRRVVRWLRLAGNMPRPGYFEIIEPPPLPRDRLR